MAATLTQVWEAICSHVETHLGLVTWPLAEPNMPVPCALVPPLPEQGVARATFGNDGYYGASGGDMAVWTVTVVMSADLLKESAKALLSYADPVGERSVWQAFAAPTGEVHQTLGGIVESCAVLRVTDQRAIAIDEQLLGWGFEFEVQVSARRSS